MKIDWTPSVKLLTEIKEIARLREQEKKTWEQISSVIGHHRTYTIALYKKYKEDHT